MVMLLGGGGFSTGSKGDATPGANHEIWFMGSIYDGATGAVLVDYDIFVKVAAPGPDPRTLYKPADFDFQLRAGSAAVDAGVRLSGIDDDFTGKAPDLGAYEVGKPVPHYGPRP